MPYRLNEAGTTVVQAESGKPVPGGEHKTHEEALAHLGALEANVSDADKAAPVTNEDIAARLKDLQTQMEGMQDEDEPVEYYDEEDDGDEGDEEEVMENAAPAPAAASAPTSTVSAPVITRAGPPTATAPPTPTVPHGDPSALTAAKGDLPGHEFHGNQYGPGGGGGEGQQGGDRFGGRVGRIGGGRYNARELGQQGMHPVTARFGPPKVGGEIDYYDNNGDKQYARVASISQVGKMVLYPAHAEGRFDSKNPVTRQLVDEKTGENYSLGGAGAPHAPREGGGYGGGGRMGGGGGGLGGGGRQKQPKAATPVGQTPKGLRKKAHKVAKAFQDIPGLAHAENEADCVHCNFHRDFLEEKSSEVSKDTSTTTSMVIPITYCAKYDSKVQCDWTCTDWAPEGEHPDAESEVVEEGVLSEADLAAPNTSFGLVAKTVRVSQGNFNIFFPITKVDAEKREVWGYAILEQPDHTNEIMDYTTSKPFFERWSAGVAKDSGGKSLGNVREMHEAWAAGKLVSFSPDDQAKGFFVGAKVVDDAAWTKVEEGVYTGFSVGGQYVRRWPDQDRRLTRYTANPGEISLVDRPCVPGATYQMVKHIGLAEAKMFQGGGSGHDQFLLAKQLPASTSGVETTATHGEADPATTDPKLREGKKFDETMESHQRMLVGREIPVTGISGAQATQQYGAARDLSAEASRIVSDTPPAGIRKIKIKGVQPMANAMQKDDSSVVSQARNIVGAIKEQVGRGEVDAALLNQLGALFDVSVESAPDTHSTQTSGESKTPPSGEETSSGHQTPPSSSSTATKTTDSSSTPTGGSTPSSSVPSSGSASTPTGSSPTPTTEPVSTETQSMSKGNDPTTPQAASGQPETFSGVPPATNIFAKTEHPDEDLIPQMLSALASGSLRKAQQLVNYEQPRFDALFNRALMWWMTQEGITAQNIRKLHTGAPTDFDPDYLKKSIVSTDIPGIYLMRLARLMLPVYAGLVRRLPAATPETGADKAQWRAQLGFSNLNFANNLHVAEGGIGDEITETFLTFATPYRDLALNDKVTLKATAASRGYDDPLQVAVIRALTAILQLQERKVIGDNAAALATPGAATATPSTTGGTLAAGTGYTVSISALTYTGFLGGVKGGTLTAGAGETDSSITTAITTTGATSSIAVTWAAVPGAVAYNVYLSSPTGTAIRYVATVTATSYTITAYPGSGNAPSGTNQTLQATGYEGLIQWCTQSTIYSNVIPNKLTPVDLAGAALTTNGSGITEFDSVLSNMWTKWQISPSLILTSANGVSSYTSKIMTLNMPQYRVDVTDKQGQLVGGSFVTYYVNKFAPWADGSLRTVELMAHPYMPDGTFLFLCESIPYPMSRESRGFARDQLIPYTYFPLAQVLINYPFAVTLSEAVECFHPSVQTALTSVKVT